MRHVATVAMPAEVGAVTTILFDDHGPSKFGRHGRSQPTVALMFDPMSGPAGPHTRTAKLGLIVVAQQGCQGRAELVDLMRTVQSLDAPVPGSSKPWTPAGVRLAVPHRILDAHPMAWARWTWMRETRRAVIVRGGVTPWKLF